MSEPVRGFDDYWDQQYSQYTPVIHVYLIMSVLIEDSPIQYYKNTLLYHFCIMQWENSLFDDLFV